jgi:hypothetical protein
MHIGRVRQHGLTPAKTSFNQAARRIPGFTSTVAASSRAGAAVASITAVLEKAVSTERRTDGADRRRNSRGGRRSNDPHTNWRWRRLAWLFAAYAVYVSVRSLPATVKDYFTRRRTPA